MGLLDEVPDPPKYMPLELKIVIAWYVLSFLIDVAWLAFTEVGVGHWVRMAIAAGIALGLIRGSEGVRVIVRFFAGAGVFFGLVGTIQLLSLGAMSSTLGLVGLGAAIGTMTAGAFTFWALGRANVQAWLVQRSYGRA